MNLIRASKFFLLIMIWPLIAAHFSSCKDEISAEQEFLNKVNGKWTSTTTGVSVDGVVVNGAFSGFSITINDDGNYTTQNGNSPIWPASGNITVVSASTTIGFKFMRSDGVEIDIQAFTDTSLVLKFQYIDPNGRASSVSGIYNFDLERN